MQCSAARKIRASSSSGAANIALATLAWIARRASSSTSSRAACCTRSCTNTKRNERSPAMTPLLQKSASTGRRKRPAMAVLMPSANAIAVRPVASSSACRSKLSPSSAAADRSARTSLSRRPRPFCRNATTFSVVDSRRTVSMSHSHCPSAPTWIAPVAAASSNRRRRKKGLPEVLSYSDSPRTATSCLSRCNARAIKAFTSSRDSGPSAMSAIAPHASRSVAIVGIRAWSCPTSCSRHARTSMKSVSSGSRSIASSTRSDGRSAHCRSSRNSTQTDARAR